MDERRLQYAVGGVAACAVLGLGFFSSRPQRVHGKLKVTAQWSSTLHGPDAKGPPGVYLQIEKPETIDNIDSVNLKVVDEAGRSIPVLPLPPGRFSHIVPLGYARTPAHPRLVATLKGYERPSASSSPSALIPLEPTEIGSVPLDPFPTPASGETALSPDAPFRLVREGDHVLIRPTRLLGPGDSWDVSALATNGGIRLPDGTFRAYVTPGPEGCQLRLPYPSETKNVQVQITALHQKTTTATLTVLGLRLVSSRGETTFRLAGPIKLNTPDGLHVVVSEPTARKRASAKDHRAPELFLDVPADPARNIRPIRVQVDVLSPRAEALGLNSYTIGTGRSVSSLPATGPIDRKPFNVVLRITAQTLRTDLAQTYSVKVEDR